MLFSLSFLSAVLMGATTVSAVDATGYRISNHCGQAGEDQTNFPWGKMNTDCYTWDDNGPQGINSVNFTNIGDNSCPINSTSVILAFSDPQCTQRVKTFELFSDLTCLQADLNADNSVASFFGFQHVCCLGQVEDDNCSPSA